MSLYLKHTISIPASATCRYVCLYIYRNTVQYLRLTQVTTSTAQQLNETWTNPVELEPDPDPVTLLSILLVGELNIYIAPGKLRLINNIHSNCGKIQMT